MHRIAQADIRERLIPETLSYNRGAFCVWIVAFALLLGIVAFGSQQEWLLDYFQPLAYLAIGYSFVRTLYTWRDPFNPLCLIIAAGFVRFLLPGILILNGAESSEEVSALFRLMHLSHDDWQWGYALALTGISATILGWLLTQQRWMGGSLLKFNLTVGTKHAAVVGMIVGSLALFAFVVINASLSAILSGSFRGTTVQVGTGKYFFLAYLLIGSSVLLSCYFMARGHGWYSLAPVLVAGLLYSVLGGRNRAATPIVCGLLLAWYFSREKNSWRELSVRPLYVMLAPFVLIFAVWLSYVGLLYRGELGIRAFAEAMSLTGFWQHVQGSVFTDLGQLHSLAGAISIGPGVLDGQTFYGSLSWPLGTVLPIAGRSAGVFLTEMLLGFGPTGEKWGFNASLIGDAYLNFGFGGVVLVLFLFGALLKVLYLKFRQGSLHGAIYVLFLQSAIQVFWVSIEVWPQALTTLSFTFLLIMTGSTIFRVPRVAISR